MATTPSLLSGLITDGKDTVHSIASKLLEHADQSSLNRFLTLYEWEEEQLNRRRLDLLQSMRETRWRWSRANLLVVLCDIDTGIKIDCVGTLPISRENFITCI
jgi:hypothetical protein